METVAPDRSLVSHFASLEDNRCPLKRRHVLHEMIVIAIAAILSGADGWVGIAQFGRSKRAWLQGFLTLPHGIPSHDTFGRVFGLLEPAAFEACFRAWVESIRELLPGEVVAIDGKTLRPRTTPVCPRRSSRPSNRVTDAASGDATAPLGQLGGLSNAAAWEGLNMLGMVESECERDGKITRETRYYIGSIGLDAPIFAGAARGHCGIENSLHWSLDVAFREDESRVRDDNARENLGVLRHIALNRLKNDNTKLGIANKRLRAGWDDTYLDKLLFAPPDQPAKTHTSAPLNILTG